MAIFFHVVSVAWSLPDCKTASQSESSEAQKTKSLSLNSLCPKRLDFTEKELELLSREYEQEEGPSKWTELTIIESIRYSRIQNVSFVAKNPHLPHVAYMKRSEENEDISKNICFTFAMPGYIFGVEKVDGCFFLAQKSLKETLQGIDVEDSGPLEKVLNCFQHEENTAGIALTILERSSRVHTYLWFK